MTPSSCGAPLDTGVDRWGELEPVLREDVPEALERDGFALVRDFYDRREAIAARESVLQGLAKDGLLHPDRDWRDAVANPAADLYFRPDLAQAPVEKLVYGERVMQMAAQAFGEPARHYDYTWLRTVSPGHSTEPHFDVVYMGRGSSRVLTCWTPLSDIDEAMGGLMILEGSHRVRELRDGYGTLDVDTACSTDAAKNQLEAHGFRSCGSISRAPAEIADRYDLRWLTTNYRIGDLLVFGMFTLHGSLDNRSDRVRVSVDSRVQPASEPIDERWVGPEPMGHGERARRDAIC